MENTEIITRLSEILDTIPDETRSELLETMTEYLTYINKDRDRKSEELLRNIAEARSEFKGKENVLCSCLEDGEEDAINEATRELMGSAYKLLKAQRDLIQENYPAAALIYTNPTKPS